MDGMVHGRWHGASPCGNERIIALWTNVLRAYEGKSSGLIPPGPRSRESVNFQFSQNQLLGGVQSSPQASLSEQKK